MHARDVQNHGTDIGFNSKPQLSLSLLNITFENMENIFSPLYGLFTI